MTRKTVRVEQDFEVKWPEELAISKSDFAPGDYSIPEGIRAHKALYASALGEEVKDILAEFQALESLQQEVSERQDQLVDRLNKLFTERVVRAQALGADYWRLITADESQWHELDLWLGQVSVTAAAPAPDQQE